MKRIKRVPLRRAGKSQLIGANPPEVSEHQTPEWVLRMRERGIDVREPRPGAVIEPFNAVRQAGLLLAFWRRAVRRFRE